MKILTFAAIAALPFLAIATSAQAGGVTLTLSRTALTNVTDAAGQNQIEAGKLLKGATQIGYYTITRRVTTGATTAYNVGAETITLLVTGTTVPQNIWLQGVHSFSSGNAYGSVSAASYNYDWIRSASYSKTSATSLYIYWNGSNSLSLP